MLFVAFNLFFLCMILFWLSILAMLYMTEELTANKEKPTESYSGSQDRTNGTLTQHCHCFESRLLKVDIRFTSGVRKSIANLINGPSASKFPPTLRLVQGLTWFGGHFCTTREPHTCNKRVMLPDSLPALHTQPHPSPDKRMSENGAWTV